MLSVRRKKGNAYREVIPLLYVRTFISQTAWLSKITIIQMWYHVVQQIIWDVWQESAVTTFKLIHTLKMEVACSS
jgi:hypothetical protein